MAYVNKEKKAKIVEAVKKVLPKDWKVTFAVHNYSTIVCTIRKAPVDLEMFGDRYGFEGYMSVNHYHLDKYPGDKKVLEILNKIADALNTDNYNNSDIMTDYFDVGHYIELRFGEWDKPFVNTTKPA